MFNRFVNERTLLIVTSVGIFYFLYTKYLELLERQEYLEQNVTRVVEHLNKQTIDEVVRESVYKSDDEERVSNMGEEEVSSLSVEIGDSTADEMADNMLDHGMETDEYSYLPSDDHDEAYDDPNLEPDTETIVITSERAIKHCPVVLHSGKRKGFVCGKAAQDNGYCGVHKNHVPTPMEPTEHDAMAADADVDQ